MCACPRAIWPTSLPAPAPNRPALTRIYRSRRAWRRFRRWGTPRTRSSSSCLAARGATIRLSTRYGSCASCSVRSTTTRRWANRALLRASVPAMNPALLLRCPAPALPPPRSTPAPPPRRSTPLPPKLFSARLRTVISLTTRPLPSSTAQALPGRRPPACSARLWMSSNVSSAATRPRATVWWAS